MERTGSHRIGRRRRFTARAVAAVVALGVVSSASVSAASAASIAPTNVRTAEVGTVAQPARVGGFAVAEHRQLLGELSVAGGHARGAASGIDSLAGGPWCNYQCITSGVAYLVGSEVHIVVTTSVPTLIYLSVVTDDESYFAVETSAGLTTELTMVLDDLESGEKYYVMAAASDIYENTSHAWGSFTMP